MESFVAGDRCERFHPLGRVTPGLTVGSRLWYDRREPRIVGLAAGAVAVPENRDLLPRRARLYVDAGELWTIIEARRRWQAGQPHLVALR